MLSHADLAVLAGNSYSGVQSGTVSLDVHYDLIKRGDEVVVVMPGTHPSDPLDWLRDLDTWPSWFAGIGLLHSGFGEGAEALWPKLAKVLPTSGLITYTGHSLGGTLAQGLAAIHAREGHGSSFRFVTFGAPRISFLNPWFGHLARSGTEGIEYARRGDVVPDVPLRPLYGHPTRPTALGTAIDQLSMWDLFADFVEIPATVAANHSIALYASDLKALEGG